MSKIPEFRVWYDNKMWCLAKLDLWGDPDQAICDLAPYLPKYEELYDIYLSDVILMQSTGLKDKNGVEIFEGDIVILCWSDEVGESHWGKVIIKNPFEYTPEEARYFIYSDEIEVIGSIYEHKHLLE